MRAFPPISRALSAGLAALLLIPGCAGRPVDVQVVRPPVEALYMTYLELERVRSDLAVAGQAHFFRSDQTLGRIQMLNRLLEQANLVAYYQWRLLSITEYIRESHLEDFFTLRRSGLREAKARSEAVLQFLGVYAVDLADRRVLDLLDEGRGLVRRQIAHYDRLLEVLPSGPEDSRSL